MHCVEPEGTCAHAARRSAPTGPSSGQALGPLNCRRMLVTALLAKCRHGLVTVTVLPFALPQTLPAAIVDVLRKHPACACVRLSCEGDAPGQGESTNGSMSSSAVYRPRSGMCWACKRRPANGWRCLRAPAPLAARGCVTADDLGDAGLVDASWVLPSVATPPHRCGSASTFTSKACRQPRPGRRSRRTAWSRRAARSWPVNAWHPAGTVCCARAARRTAGRAGSPARIPKRQSARPPNTAWWALRLPSFPR